MTIALTIDWRPPRDPSGPVTCAACGCRLQEAAGLEGLAWRHFQLGPDTDARGDRPRCLEDLHARDGYVLTVSELDSLVTAARSHGES